MYIVRHTLAYHFNRHAMFNDNTRWCRCAQPGGTTPCIASHQTLSPCEGSGSARLTGACLSEYHHQSLRLAYLLTKYLDPSWGEPEQAPHKRVCTA